MSFVRNNLEFEGLSVGFPSHPSGGAFSMTINNFQFQISLIGIFSGLIVLALSEAFRQGKVNEDEDQVIINHIKEGEQNGS